MTSATIGALAAALAKAQAQIEGASKANTNPHFKSKYADLSSVWEACRGPLAANGLAVTQTVSVVDDGRYTLVTRLAHTSGEWVMGEIPLLLGKADMQGLGSAITYARRYGLAAIVGVSPEDDDGNAAVATVAQVREKPVGYDDWLDDITAAAEIGLEALTATWKDSLQEYRDYTPQDVRDSLKARAKGKK